MNSMILVIVLVLIIIIIFALLIREYKQAKDKRINEN